MSIASLLSTVPLNESVVASAPADSKQQISSCLYFVWFGVFQQTNEIRKSRFRQTFLGSIDHYPRLPQGHKELETAVATHYNGLDAKLANSVAVGGPNEAGIQRCIQRQKVRYLLDKLRLEFKPSSLDDHSLGNTIVRSEISTLRADRPTLEAAA
jgi:hypothetical protein